jgi:hypothetical protein
MSLKPYLILTLVILLAALGVACGSSTPAGTSQDGASSPTASAADATETTGAPVTKEPTATSEPLGPVFAGFDFPVQEGTYWEYEWEYEKGTFCLSCRSGPSVDSGVFRVTLGQPKEIEGLIAYEVQVTGKYRRDDIELGSGYGPRWSYLAVDDNLIFVSEDGDSLTVLFDGQEGRWPGSGFFTTRFETEHLYEGQAQGSDVVVQASTQGGEGGCVFYRSVGRVCSSGEDFDYTATETYRQGVGPVAYSYRYSFSSGSGSNSFSLSTTESVSLVRSSLR